MICPKCKAEYLDHIQKCGDCKVSLINASNVELPIPEMSWSSIPPFEGKIYADMVAELLDQHSIPYYMKMDWASSAFSVEAANLSGQTIRIFVPEKYIEKASEITSSILGK